MSRVWLLHGTVVGPLIGKTLMSFKSPSMPASSCGKDEEGATLTDSKLAVRRKRRIKDLPLFMPMALTVLSFVGALVCTCLLPVRVGYIYLSVMKKAQQIESTHLCPA